MKKNNNTWFKVVLTIIIIEVIIGGIIFAYKKLAPKDDNKISIKDELVLKLYNKVDHLDVDAIDIMDQKVILYYGYHNVEKKESINCELTDITDDTTGYSCSDITDFIKSEELEKAVQNVYGKDIGYINTSFEIDKNTYAFYDETNDGYAIYTKDEEETIDTYNLELIKADKKDNKIVLTIDKKDGIFGTVLNTYNYIFEKDGSEYYLIGKEKVTN